MSKVTFTIAGFALGAIIGSSTGVAFGGDAYNGALVFGPICALVGWLFASKGSREDTDRDSDLRAGIVSEGDSASPSPQPNDGRVTLAAVIHAAIVMLAMVWNAHIALLDALRVLPVFKERPWLFFVFAIAVSIIFPPFAIIYVVCYVAAAHLGLSDKGDFRAKIR